MTDGRYCYTCGEACGTLLVCEPCRTQLAPSDFETLTRLWHDEVCERAYDEQAERYRCFHCSLYFRRNQVCGDHFPDTKAAAPKKRFDVAAGVCSCAGCNTSGNRNRTKVKKNLCAKCRLRLPVYGGLCIGCA